MILDLSTTHLNSSRNLSKSLHKIQIYQNRNAAPALTIEERDVDFPEAYRQKLANLQTIVLREVIKTKDAAEQAGAAYYKTAGRQEMLTSMFPPLVDYWLESDKNREETFRAVGHAKKHLSATSEWLTTHPLFKHMYRTAQKEC